MNQSLLFTLALPDGTGAHRMCHQFVLAFRRAGWRISLVAGRMVERSQLSAVAQGLLEELEEAGVDLRFEPGFGRLWAPTLVRRLVEQAKLMGAAGIVAINQRDRKFALWAGQKARLPVFISVQNQHTFHGRTPVRQLKRELYGHLIRQARLLVCPSPVVQQELLRLFRVAPERTAILPNGIDVHRFTAVRSPGPRSWADLGVAEDEILAANVGRLDRQKGQDLLLEAMARVAERHPRLRLGLIGAASATGAEFEQYLHARTIELGLQRRVLFAGWQNEVSRLLTDSDVYIHTARWEGLSLSVLEALASGLPTGYTDCSGRLEGFQEGLHGWTIKTGSVDEMAAALDKLAALSLEERQRMGLAARELVVRSYDVERVLGPAFVDLVKRTLPTAPASS